MSQSAETNVAETNVTVRPTPAPWALRTGDRFVTWSEAEGVVLHAGCDAERPE